MVLPFTSNTNNTANNINDQSSRTLSEEEQVFLAIDQGVHEVKYNLV